MASGLHGEGGSHDGSGAFHLATRQINTTIGFNAKYIMDVLNSIDDDEVDLNLKDQLSPGVVRPQADQAYTCVIMPMRI